MTATPSKLQQESPAEFEAPSAEATPNSRASDAETAPAEFPFVIARARVTKVEVLSPNFVRIEFGGDDLQHFGTPGQTFDQRIKLIFPGASGTLPELSGPGDSWYQEWLSLPEDTRGSIRTYSVRDLIRAADGSPRVVIDFVLHLVPGATGPASSWAAAATEGDELLLFGPRTGVLVDGGIEFEPGSASTILLVGDETAAPAIARIIEDLGATAHQNSGDAAPAVQAFIEVPQDGDQLDINLYEGAEVTWLPRNGKHTGTVVIPSVLHHLGAQSDSEMSPEEIVDIEGEELAWETPQFSRLGEQTAVGENHASSYFWIAGESGTVTTLRRHLVRGLSIDRRQVAFMGYWRQGVSMKG